MCASYASAWLFVAQTHECISFPELVGDKPCMEGNRIVANGTSMTPHSSVPVLPTETTPVKKCERVTSGCSFNE